MPRTDRAFTRAPPSRSADTTRHGCAPRRARGVSAEEAPPPPLPFPFALTRSGGSRAVPLRRPSRVLQPLLVATDRALRHPLDLQHGTQHRLVLFGRNAQVLVSHKGATT